MPVRDPYFTQMQTALRDAGVVTPVLLVDQDRLDANIARLRGDLPAGMGYRIVAKSLPCAPLLRRIMEGASTDRLMTFNLPMLRDIAQTFPKANQFLGKPLGVAAARAFYGTAPLDVQVTWLIDTVNRLRDYDSMGVPMQIALELNVGLHRGGFVPGDEFRTALETLRDSPTLRFAGLMGYEPHVPALPQLFGWQNRALQSAWATYRAAQSQVADILGADALTRATLNAAGSPTFRLYRDTSVANEVSVGSALVKPTDFDTTLLADYQPACFIATPVVKAPHAAPLPGLDRLQPLRRLIPGQAEHLFIHGGHWLATPTDPPGLRYNNVFGRSSNQELLTGPADLPVAADDFVFLRPNQSEALFLQFGDIVVYAAGKVVNHWPTFAISA